MLGTRLGAAFLVLALAGCGGEPQQSSVETAPTGTSRPTPGGRLVAALGAEPQTLNPIFASDRPSREMARRTTADLIHINRLSQKTEGALAESWTVSDDGRRFVLTLRQGVRFSDGDAFDADDVLFSFRVHQDEAVGAPSRDLLVLDGEPIEVRKIDAHTVEFELTRPHAVGDRIFDSIPILPSHLLTESYEKGVLHEAWRLDSAPEEIAGLGPFRLKRRAPAQRLVLERNPYYWKTDEQGTQLPYLDELVYEIIPSQETQVLRFRAGEIDIIDDLKAADFEMLQDRAESRGYRLFDLGAGLSFNLVFFNLNPAAPGDAKAAMKRKWFQKKEFRQAIAAAIDREAIARLVYRGRAAPIWSHVSPANEPWFDSELPRPPRSIDRARKLLETAGFSWRDSGLVDADGTEVSFTLVTNANKEDRVKMMTIIQEDLREVGIKVQSVPLEFSALLTRILDSRDYDLCVVGLGGGDIDPNPLMNVLLSSARNHLWNPSQSRPATDWEAEIDRLMTEQATELVYERRKALYDRVQKLLADELPMIPLVSPNVLVGAQSKLGNFKPAILDHHTLWNVDELYWVGD